MNKLISPANKKKISRHARLLSQLPEPVEGKEGWPWTEETVLSWCVNVNWPRVTVVTPSYHQGVYIEETIRSVLLQNYPNLEYIIIDGGSCDQALSIIKKYEPWITYWVSEPDGGQAEAINKGFLNATGDLFAWINSDDYYLPAALKQLVESLSANDADFVYGDVFQVKNQGAPYPWRNGARFDLTTSLTSLYIPIPQQGAMWKKTLWGSVGGLNPKWHCVLDRDFFIRCALQHNFFYKPGPIAVSRIHSEAKSSAQVAGWIDELPKMYKEFFCCKDLPISIKKTKRKSMYAVWQRCADISRRCGGGSARFLLFAFITSPALFIKDEMTYLKHRFLSVGKNR